MGRVSDSIGPAGAVDALYAGDPADFVAGRDALIKQARARKDRPLAADLKRLRRPTVGAWYVNLAMRAGLTSLREWLKLGRELRDAQAALDFPRVVALGPRRAELERRVLADLAAHLGQLGVTVSAPALEEVRSTLRAALTDADAAAAVASGRLERPLEYGALMPVSAPTPGGGQSPGEGEGVGEGEAEGVGETEAVGEGETEGEGEAERPETRPDTASEPEPPEDDLDELERQAATAEAALAASRELLESVRAQRARLLARRQLTSAEQRLAAAAAEATAARAEHDRLSAALGAAAERLAAALADEADAVASLAALQRAAERP